MSSWTEAERRASRNEYARLYQTGHQHRASHVVEIPADIIVLERDPSPCGFCGVRGDVPCRHRPWVQAA